MLLLFSCLIMANSLWPPPTIYSLSVSSAPGILARILEWVAISFSRRSSRSWDQTHVSYFERRTLYPWATWEAHRIHWTFQVMLMVKNMPAMQETQVLYRIHILLQNWILFDFRITRIWWLGRNFLESSLAQLPILCDYYWQTRYCVCSLRGTKYFLSSQPIDRALSKSNHEGNFNF